MGYLPTQNSQALTGGNGYTIRIRSETLRVCPRENQAKSKKSGTGQISHFDETLPEDRL